MEFEWNTESDDPLCRLYTQYYENVKPLESPLLAKSQSCPRPRPIPYVTVPEASIVTVAAPPTRSAIPPQPQPLPPADADLSHFNFWIYLISGIFLIFVLDLFFRMGFYAKTSSFSK
jgi:hypothetical protein